MGAIQSPVIGAEAPLAAALSRPDQIPRLHEGLWRPHPFKEWQPEGCRKLHANAY